MVWRAAAQRGLLVWRSPATRVGALSIAGAIVAVMVAGHVGHDVGPFATTASVRPALGGRTSVHLPPLGSIRLDTHAGIVHVSVRVDELRVREARQIARDPSVLDDLEDEIAGDARDALAALAIRASVAAVVGATLGALVVRRHWKPALAGVLVGSALSGVALVSTAATFEPGAVAEPEYTGLLALAPTAVGDVEAIIDRFGEYRAQLTDLVANAVSLYRAAQDLPVARTGDDAVRVLHVSDIHNNPQAFDLIETLVDHFDVAAVFDSGDTTDWGTEPESRLLRRIGRLGVPYVWVRGNHDSRGTQGAVAEIENAIVLDGEAAEVGGLRVWGVGDPRYTPDKDQPTGKEAERAQADAFAAEARRRLLDDAGEPVDVVLVHDPRIAADVGDLVPLVLAGHLHEPSESTVGDALVLVEGSTGGAGLRALRGDEPEPLTATVLSFDRATRRLVAYDRVTVAGLGEAGARIERHVVEPGAPAEPER